ncbi:MAG: flippase-like domain-containing protein [Chloroflexi bacterium]|nr:flippase-like domain-containing protein [Chloroflexota bacterium]
MKKFARLAISILIGAALLILWLRLVDFQDMVSYFKQIRPWWIVLAMFLYILSFFIRSLRWRLFLAPVARLPVGKVFAVFMCGTLINYLVPIRAGELAKSLILKKLDGLPTSRTLPGVFLDKICDMIPVLLLLILLPLMAFHLPDRVMWIIFGVLAVFIAFLILLVGAALKKKLAANLLKRFFNWLPESIRGSVHRFLDLFIEGFSEPGRYGKFLPAVLLLTIAAVLCDASYLMTMFAGFGAHPPFILVLFGYTLINLSYILPTPPAQIGSNEVLWVIIFTGAFGMNVNLVSAVESFAHVLTAALLIGAGAVSSAVIGMKLANTFKLEKDNAGNNT